MVSFNKCKEKAIKYKKKARTKKKTGFKIIREFYIDISENLIVYCDIADKFSNIAIVVIISKKE